MISASASAVSWPISSMPAWAIWRSGCRWRAANAQALPGIGQAQRPRRAGQARGRQPRDLRRGVGAQAHHALAVRVHEPKCLLGGGSTGAGKQAVLEFEQGCCDALIAVRGEAIHDRSDGTGFQLCLRRQNVAQAGGQKGRVGERCFVHGNQSLWRGAIALLRLRSNCIRFDFVLNGRIAT